MKAAVLPLCLVLAACVVTPQPPPAPVHPTFPAPTVRPHAYETYSIVTANADAARVLQGLHNRGLAVIPSDASRAEMLAGSPGYAWRIGTSDHLHIHVYRDRQWAAGAARRFIDTATARSQITDWVGKPHLFDCGTALVLHLGEVPQALNVITYMCGPPLWRG